MNEVNEVLFINLPAMKTGKIVNHIGLSFTGLFFFSLCFASFAQPPVVGDIPNQEIEEGKSFASISLDNFVADPDHTIDQITWSYSTPVNLSVNIDNSRIATILAPSTDWNGSETITFTATDPLANSSSDNATFLVNPVNDPPVLLVIPDQVYAEGDPFQPINLDEFVSDVDNSKDQLIWSARGNTALSVGIDALSHVATIGTPNNDWFGAENIIFSVADLEASDSDTASFRLTAVNDAPVIGNIPDQLIKEGGSFDTVRLDDYVTDVDNAKSELHWNITGNVNLKTEINRSRVAKVTAPKKFTGAEALTFIVQDPGNASASDLATYTVEALASPPTDILLSSNTIAENLAVNSVVGTLSALDPDIGDTFIFSLVSGSGSADNGSFNISGNQLQTSEVFNYETKNSYSIRINVYDGTDNYEKAFTISVTNVNEAPTSIGLSPSSVIENLSANTVVGTLSAVDPDIGDTHTFSLVSGTGSTDNSSFNISSGQLRTSAVFNFEVKSTYNIRVRATDSNSNTYEEALVVTVTNANETPTDINLSATSIAENLPVNSVVGTLSAVDPDAGDTHTYALVAGTGSTNNGSFNIAGDQLRSDEVFNYATKSSYSIRVRATDALGLTAVKIFIITITNANDPPTDIALTPSSVIENLSANTVVGSLSAVDPDIGDTHTFSLVSGTGSTDNSSFNISSGQLRTSAVFDYETKSTYSIRVRATDAGSQYFEKALTVTVTNQNENPTDIGLTSNSIIENLPVNSVVGTLSAVDPDAGDTHTYALVAGTGSTNNGSFNILGNQLRSDEIFNFETKATYSIRVRATDALGLTTAKIFTITITNANEPPTDIALTASSVIENLPANTVVGTLSAVDPDIGDTHTFSLVSGTGSADNASFNILANQLRTSAVFDYETKASYSIRLRVNDGTNDYEEVFIITVTNVNEPPTDITLAPSTVTEGLPINTVVGALSAIDPDAGSTHTFTLVAGTGSTDNGSFNIAGIQLRTSAIFDFETKATYNIRVRATDAGSLFFEEALTVTVTNVNDVAVITVEITPLIYCARSAATVISPTLTITGSGTTLASATVRISTGYVSTEDVLTYTAPSGITGSYNAGTGTVTFSGASTLANYQTALRSVRYQNTNLVNPSTAARTITFIVNDGTDNSGPATRNITVNPIVKGIMGGGVQEVCNDGVSKGVFSIDLSGTTPWTVTVRRRENSVYDTTFTSVATDPFVFTGRVIGTTVPSATRHRVYAITDGNNCVGDTTGSGSAWVRYKDSPTAVISGIDTICPGVKTTKILIDFTGTGPWDIRYRRNSGSPVAINGITKMSDYVLEVTQAGTYTLVSVFDHGVDCSGKVSGTGLVRSTTVPTATISGTTTICEHTTTNLNVTLTGTSPWKFVYTRNAGDSIEIPNVQASPASITVNQGGTYTLYEVYDKNCKGTVSGSAVINVSPAPDVTLSGLAPAYNKQSTEWVLITGTPSGGTFTGPGLIPYNGSWYFLPSLPPIGTHNIVYSYRASPGSCYGYDTVVVRVLEASALIEFENNRTKYCLNDAPFTVTGVNLAGSIGTFTISGGLGIADHHDNTATIYPSQLSVSEYTVTYTYFDGTNLSTSKKFDVGGKPVADFVWETECYETGQTISIKSTSTSPFGNLTDTSYMWKVYNATGFDTYTTRDITHVFPEAGNHNIKLKIENSYGCADSLERTFGLRPTFLLDNATYEEDFETSPISWLSNTPATITVNSWMLSDPYKGFTGPSSGIKCWYTFIPATNAPREQSWVTSPCFDFSDTEKPMLKVNIWRWFNALRDGATLQASADSGKTWTILGQLDDGVNWFNEYTILGNPGGQSIGWSNKIDAGWIEARHALDQFKGKTRVQFRIAYGSDGTARSTNGIAFDDFWIGERDRTTLLEHFTNSSDIASKDANIEVNELVNANELSLIDLQYHTGFPGPDPFNDDEPFIPGTRLLYYGLSDVPTTVLNGGYKPNYVFDYNLLHLEGSNLPLIESLLDSKFGIVITSNLNGNVLNITTSVSSPKAVPATEITLHVAVVERLVTNVSGTNGETSFESVVKTLLPDAAGTTVNKSWTAGEYKNFVNECVLGTVYDYSELRIVAFLQNEATLEVYQAAIDTIGISTAIPDPLQGDGLNNGFFVYPNPASITARLKFRNSLKEEAVLELYNNLGSLVYTGNLSKGTDEFDLPVAQYPDGVYIVRILSKDMLIGLQKLTITR